MESKIIFGEMIDYLRKKNGLSMEEFGNIFDKNKSTISRWIKGTRFPKIEEAEEIANYFNIPFEVLIFGAGKLSKLNSIYQKLNPPRQEKVYNFAESQLDEQNSTLYEEEYDYLGEAAAGAPIEGQQPVPFVGIETVKLLVNGDSMEPRYEDGDIIEYRPQPELENGQIGVFAVNGGVTLKKFKSNGDVRLQSLNRKYEDIIIHENDDFTILGKVL